MADCVSLESTLGPRLLVLLSFPSHHEVNNLCHILLLGCPVSHRLRATGQWTMD